MNGLANRKVQVYRYDPKQQNVQLDDGVATFHGWGVDFEPMDHGVGNYSTAIIEREDGTIESVYVGNIQFIKEH